MPLLSTNMRDNRPRKVWIVEGGYSDKYTRKETQHEHLQPLLQARGLEVIIESCCLSY